MLLEYNHSKIHTNVSAKSKYEFASQTKSCSILVTSYNACITEMYIGTQLM